MTCIMPNCRKRAPAGEAFCSDHRQDDTAYTISRVDLDALNSELARYKQAVAVARNELRTFSLQSVRRAREALENVDE